MLPQAGAALDRFKYEIANELNIPTNQIQGDYWGNLSAAQCGAVGGHMVRRMIEAAERSLVEGTLQGVRAGFQAGLTQAGYTSPTNVPNVGNTTTKLQ
ncbi:MAG TPA: alpha/beta-type small acid-soluble spore protein [Firmicutes bacterium]|nr:alpha/beta-type small acid-soluble spore protein [Bacillota bacterium]